MWPCSRRYTVYKLASCYINVCKNHVLGILPPAFTEQSFRAHATTSGTARVPAAACGKRTEVICGCPILCCFPVSPAAIRAVILLAPAHIDSYYWRTAEFAAFQYEFCPLSEPLLCLCGACAVTTPPPKMLVGDRLPLLSFYATLLANTSFLARRWESFPQTVPCRCTSTFSVERKSARTRTRPR